MTVLLLAWPATANEEDPAKDDLGWGEGPRNVEVEMLLKREADALEKSGRCSSSEHIAVLCEQTKDIIALCERTWKPDFSTQQECEEWERISARNMSSYLKLPITDERRKIVTRCMEENSNRGLTDWTMTEACLHYQVSAEELLR